MKFIFPIVGIRHYVPAELLSDFVYSLPSGAEVFLVYDNANPHDRYAIQAWMAMRIDDQPLSRMQVGYVSSDYAPLIRHNYPDASMLYATVVHPDTSVEEPTYFEVELEVENFSIPIPPPRIDLSPIAQLPLPSALPEKRMVWDEIIRYNNLFQQLTEETPPDDELIRSILDLAHRSAPYFGHSLSGDERNAYILLSSMLTALHAYWPSNVMDVWEERMNIEDIHHDAYKTADLCAQVMEQEMLELEQNILSFFDQYKQVLASGLTTKEQEIAAHKQWLTALPDNLYAWIKDRPTFASKLYYSRFSSDELYAIYLHLLCLEWLSKQRVTPMPESVEQAINTFSFWHSAAASYQKRLAVQEWREASLQHKEPIATIALRIKQQQDARVLKSNLLPFTKFVDELNRFLPKPIKQNSLRKRYQPGTRDTYVE